TSENIQSGVINVEESLSLQGTQSRLAAQPFQILDSSQLRGSIDDGEMPILQVTHPTDVATTFQSLPLQGTQSGLQPFEVSTEPAIQSFYNRALNKMNECNPIILVPLSTAIFGTDTFLHIVLGDVKTFCHMEDLSMNCVAMYIRRLYGILVERGTESKFKFMNPGSVTSTSFPRILSRLDTSHSEWVLVPLNPEGEGWVLAVIHMETLSCYWLDPLCARSHSGIRKFITLGLLSLKAEGWKSPMWYHPKCPKHGSKAASGYYVLKFMRELLDDQNMLSV
ncbi:hypothetical protein MKX03_012897, partial [Papaver bracteatum]